ncbi:hypothetical protein A9Q84_06875 [Halobacteriovorax marinus]|uniref:Response regulatory domain-containing protein n=1 Tax=Halobacteriovorax marinus TaxID=97084 RepID=A0A1Y5FFC9_9BACT|nr:hypothetical protein A9Q84_06875 [Halobacteriovorax marinus]
MSDKIVLIVDDEEKLVELTADLIEAMGHEVEVHTSSEKALVSFCANPQNYKLVITDHTMPGLSGVDLILKIREYSLDIPCILTTGAVLSEVEELFSADPNLTYLKKPYRRANLQELLEKYTS